MRSTDPLTRRHARLHLILRNLAHIAAIADEGSLNRAAQRLHIAQSALSRRLNEVEAELGAPLFHRHKTGLVATPIGAQFLRDTGHLLMVLDRAVWQFDINRDPEIKSLRLGFNSAAMTYPALAGTIRDFRRAHPHCALTLHSDLSEPLMDSVESETLDVAVAYRLTDDFPFHYKSLTDDRLILALPADHPLVDRPIHLRDLAAQPFITMPRSTNGRLAQMLDEATRQGGVVLRSMVEAGSAEATLNLVAAGMGFAFINRSQVGRLPPNVVVRDVQGLHVRLPLVAFWKAGREQPMLVTFVTSLALAFRSAKSIPVPEHLV